MNGLSRFVCLTGLVFGLAVTTSLKAQETAPAKYQVKFETTAGDFTVDVTRDLAPKGADQFYNAVKTGFYNDCRFFRVVPGFMVQFGINGDPAIQKQWREKSIKDDPVRASNKRGYVTFAMAGPDTRTTQVFISYADNSFLDGQGFSPFGVVNEEDMKVVDAIESKYGESPQQGAIQAAGNEYLKSKFPELDYVKKATIVEAPKMR